MYVHMSVYCIGDVEVSRLDKYFCMYKYILYMCMYIHMCMYTYTYICICMCVCVYIHT